MTSFVNIPIKRKLVAIIMAVSLTALAAVCVALGVYGHVSIREKMARDLSIIAEIVAEKSSASLISGDSEAASEVLGLLSAQPHIIAAAILDKDGKLFDKFQRKAADASDPPALELSDSLRSGHDFSAGRMTYYEPIRWENETIGSLYIARDLDELYHRMSQFAGIVALIMAGAVILTLAQTGWLQRIVTAPIIHLHRTAKAVAAEKNFSLRAVKRSDDELGQLVTAFNEMLSEIQSRDAALQRAHSDLERRVEERTSELNGANRDLTELLKKNQKTQLELEAATRHALAASEAKSNFLASMSHEIRTPMNGLMGFSALLADTPLNRTQTEYVDIMNSSGRALLTIINDILDFSKLEAGKLAVSIEPFDLREVVCSVADLLGARAAERSITLAVACPDTVPSMAIGDSGRVRQVVLNLVGNAVKFTEQGHVLVEVTADEEQRVLRCEIRDTGIGIPEQAQVNLFQKFMQADVSTTRQFGGSGLGLAISKSLVEMMHGEIGVNSASGRGSTFWFTVPLAPTERQNPRGVVPTLAADTRLLLVEPVVVNAEVMSHQLGLWGIPHEVVASTDAAIPLLMDEAGNLENWSALLLPQHVAARGDAFSEVLAGFAAAGLKILTTTRPDESTAPHAIQGTTIHFGLTGPLGRCDRLWEMVDSLNSDTPVTGETVFLSNPEPDGDPEPAAKRAKWHVLVAEDNAVNMKLATKFLEILECEVSHAVNGLEAVDCLSEREFDLVFMDCHMPECDGYQAARRIRVIEKEQKRERVPIVALTANVMSEGRAQCLSAGMDDFLAKPVDIDDLKKCLQRWAPERQDTEAVAA
jgi:two-component system sensor histidine kinase/response regulator